MVLIMRKVEEESGTKSLSLLKQVCKGWRDSYLQATKLKASALQSSKAVLTISEAPQSRSQSLSNKWDSYEPPVLHLHLSRVLRSKPSNVEDGCDGEEKEEVASVMDENECEDNEACNIEENEEVEEEDEEEEISEEDEEDKEDADAPQSIKDLTVICRNVVADCFADDRFANVTRLRLAWKSGFPQGTPDLLQYLPKLKVLTLYPLS